MNNPKQKKRLGSRTGKESTRKKVQIKEVRVKFEERKKYESYSQAVEQFFDNVLSKQFDVEYQWNTRSLTLMARPGKALLENESEKIGVILKDWRKKFRELCKRAKVETILDTEKEVIYIYLK